MKTLLFYLLWLVAVPFLAQAQSVSDADKHSFVDLQDYGTAEQGGSYWVYAHRAIGDVNRDGKTI